MGAFKEIVKYKAKACVDLIFYALSIIKLKVIYVDRHQSFL